MSFFGGSAWTYDEKSDSYYLTLFTPNQCDLNWENSKMREEIYKVMAFWLEKGVAGFRMDVINATSKASGLPDKDPHKKGLQFPMELTLNRPKTHDYLQEMYEKILKPYGCMAIGEGAVAGQDDVVLYTREDRQELQMMFHFDLHALGYGSLGKYDFRKFYRWQVRDFKKVLFSWQVKMEKEGGWLGNYLSNHDQNRHVSRFGDAKNYRKESATALCMLNLTLRGTPFLYQGEEIGMTDCVLEEEEWKDYEALNAYKVLQIMMHLPKILARRVVKKVTRDNSRTPMQWENTTNGGFTSGTPWIKVNTNYKEINVEQEEKNKDSILHFYREMIGFRKAHPVLVDGHFQPILEEHQYIIAYSRENKKEKLLVVINLSGKKIKAEKHLMGLLEEEPVLMNYKGVRDREQKIVLHPYEGRIYKMF